MNDKLKWYVVNKEYVNYLKQYDDKVENIDYSSKLKPYIGIIININEFDYYVPISSAKLKHYKIKEDNICLFTHKRAILGYLLKYAKVGYNLDENLILEFNDKIIYDDTDTSYDIYEITYDNNEVINIEKISK